MDEIFQELKFMQIHHFENNFYKNFVIIKFQVYIRWSQTDPRSTFLNLYKMTLGAAEPHRSMSLFYSDTDSRQFKIDAKHLMYY